MEKPLSPEEWVQWTALTQRIKFENGRIPLEAFYAWSEFFYTVPIELMPFRLREGGLEILLVHRTDTYYEGYHTPGAVLTPGLKSTERLQELIHRELGADATLDKLQFVRYYDTMKGPLDGENLRGQELKLVFAALIENESSRGEWFSINDLPQNIIPEFKFIIPEMCVWAREHLF